MPGRVYVSLEHSIVSFNQHVISGWSEDVDALSLPQIEIHNTKTGADGRMIASSTGDRGGEVIIKLLPNSDSLQFLLQQAYRINEGAGVVWTASVRNFQAGINTFMSRGVMTSYPAGVTMGAGDVGSQEFRWMFERIITEYTGSTSTRG